MKIQVYKKIIQVISIILIMVPSRYGNVVGRSSSYSPVPQTPIETSQIEDFDLLSAGNGWLLVNQRLYWTEDTGDNWLEITPPELSNAIILAAHFLANGEGWVVSSNFVQDGLVTFSLAKTSSRGQSWVTNDLALFSPGDVDAFPQSAYLFFIDQQTGWLVIRSASSSNFNVGVLFKTRDGGMTWQRFDIPFGEPVYFINRNIGWITGGPKSDGFYRTVDGGETWQPQTLQFIPQTVGQSVQYQNPQFPTPQLGFLPVVFHEASYTYFQVFVSEDGGLTWSMSKSTSIIPDIDPSTDFTFSTLGNSEAILIHPDTGQAYKVTESGDNSISSFYAPSAPSIVQLDMASNLIGWAEHAAGSCSTLVSSPEFAHPSTQKACHSIDELLLTHDGGLSWKSLNLPNSSPIETEILASPEPLPIQEEKLLALSIAATGKRTFMAAGQGFDKCEIPTPDKLQAWIRNSPYDAVNLYIGGAARSCSNLALNAAYISQLSQQGWKFIPTWVGPQAPCYIRPAVYMSNDPVVSRQEGVAEANAAIDTAYMLGLTLADRTGSVIYYDLERYDITNSVCHVAARAFMEGWSSQMRSRGNIPGLYSSGPILNDYFSLTQKPDVIWPAHWITSTYSSSATVWNVYQLSNTIWANHERLRQYAGGHSETWGANSITIDSSVMDGLIALGPIAEDENNNGDPEIFAVQKSGSQSGLTELYTLDGRILFTSILNHYFTALPSTNDQWVFDLADYNNDSSPDLYAFHHYATPSGKTEISILSGATAYHTYLNSVITVLPQSPTGSWVYQLGNYDQDGIPDVYAIDRDGHSVVQVSVLSGSSGYQTLVASLPTVLGRTGTSGAWAFTLGDYDQDHISDIAAINKSLGSSQKTEISILSGANNFLSYLLTIPTGLMKTGSDNGWVFFMREYNLDRIPDLFAINKAYGSQGKTEVYILDGATQYSSIILSIASGLPKTGSDCSWDFLTGQCSTTNPNILYRYFFPLAYR